MLSPNFIRVAKIEPFLLDKPIGIQLAVTGGNSCCDKTDMTNFSYQNINKKTKNIRDDPITTHTSPRQTHTSIGPGDQSEEARPLVMIDGHQAEGDTRKKSHRGILTFTQRPRTPQNKQ